MKNLQRNFTTPQQSKRLLELGVPAESADCYLQNESQDPLAYVNYTTHIIQPFHDKRIMFSQMDDYLPCWSVGRLMEILGYSEVDDMVEYLVNDIEYVVKNKNLDFSKLED